MAAHKSWMETNPARRAQLERVEALGEILGFCDSVTASEAADRLMEGGSAFWSTAGRSDDYTGRAVDCANMTGDLSEALVMINWRRRGDDAAEAMLDRLIPLGQNAVRDLEAAYARLGTFRSWRELSEREAQATDQAEPILAAAE